MRMLLFLLVVLTIMPFCIESHSLRIKRQSSRKYCFSLSTQSKFEIAGLPCWYRECVYNCQTRGGGRYGKCYYFNENGRNRSVSFHVLLLVHQTSYRSACALMARCFDISESTQMP